jgi:riboflavin synthase
MFTGIISNQGIVRNKTQSGRQIRFRFRFLKPEKNLKAGESIAINGVCLTVAQRTSREFEADVVHATLKATSLGNLVTGSRVNLERALCYGDRLGGHFISGHVDAVGNIARIEKLGKNEIWTIQAPPSVMRYVALKGSIAVDGISLTIQKVGRSDFQVALIPHTLKTTNLENKKAGGAVNLEADLLARYALLPEHRRRLGCPTGVNKRFLVKQGF